MKCKICNRDKVRYYKMGCECTGFTCPDPYHYVSRHSFKCRWRKFVYRLTGE